MVGNQEETGELRRFSSTRSRLESLDTDRTDPGPATVSTTQPTASEDGPMPDIAESVSSRPVTAETDSIDATLLGVARVPLGEFVYEHQLEDPHEAGQTRPIALFDIENTSSRPIWWESSRTKFVGDDGYTYQPATVRLNSSRLGPGCHTRQVEIEPGCRARMVTLTEELPAGVEIAEVVHTISPGTYADKQRLSFAVR